MSESRFSSPGLGTSFKFGPTASPKTSRTPRRFSSPGLGTSFKYLFANDLFVKITSRFRPLVWGLLLNDWVCGSDYIDGRPCFRPLVWGLLLNKPLNGITRREEQWFSSPGLGTSFKYRRRFIKSA